jgi:uncharacterized protein YdhG (YjbR/CyaY superfamily)
MEDLISQELKKKFLCSSRFAQEIEKIVSETKSSYIDSIIYFCEKNNIELDLISKLISKPLKDKIKHEAMELNFLKKTSKAKLPL